MMDKRREDATLTEDANLTTEQAARCLGIKASTLEAWRCEGRENQPRYIRIGNRIRYRRKDLEDFIKENQENELKQKKK